MEIKSILTHRFLVKDYYLDLVYEWEDMIAKVISANFICDVTSVRKIAPFITKYIPAIWKLVRPKSPHISFVMHAGWWDHCCAGNPNGIPIIIDFWSRDDAALSYFERRYANNPAVLITSREAYEHLKRFRPNMKIYHWPLSLPDMFSSKGVGVGKKYDCVLVGRTNKVLMSWLLRYADSHPGFTYIYNDRKPHCRNCYMSSTGEFLGDVVKHRSDYFDLISMAKTGLYSTPAIDDGREDANGFNQVTPRFLEYIAARCHVLARYPKNPDTDWYELPKMAPNLESYDEFEKAMDFARQNPVDEDKYAEYLRKHCTSVRISELVGILKEIM